MDSTLVNSKQDDLTRNKSFVELKKDPSKKIAKEVNNVLSEIFVDTEIPTRSYKLLKPQHPEAPNLYCLTKHHKEEWPTVKPGQSCQ